MSPWVPRIALGLAAAGLAGALISISIGEGGPAGKPLRGLEDTQRIYGGLRQDGARLGDPAAAVTIDVFMDIRSLADAAFANDVVDPVVDSYVRTNRAQLTIRHRSEGGTGETEAAIGATAAGDQGRQWQFARLVLDNLGDAGPGGACSPLLSDQCKTDFLGQIAAVTPELEIPAWEQALDAPTSARVPKDDDELAAQLHVPAEPAMTITGPGGSENLYETPALADVRAAIERVEVDPGA